MQAYRPIILLAVLFSGVFLLLIPVQYLYLSALIYTGLIFGLLIWFATGRYNYAIIFTLAILPLIVLCSIIPDFWQLLAIVILILLSTGWLLWWHSRNIAYECSKCSHIFSPSIMKLVTTLHAHDKRLLKCPQCGYRDWFTARKARQAGPGG
jgi:DNA-directed RNA polymerase subunit RPC12/RpoP